MTKRSSLKKQKSPKKLKASIPGRKSLIRTADAFLDKHFYKVIAILFSVSFLLGLIYFLQALNTPIMTVKKWDNSDIHFFDTWAKKISAGDWWGKDDFHPYHDWHGWLATEYFQQQPGIAAQYQYSTTDTLMSIAAKKSLINDIYKGKTFHQEPLYVYLMAITYAVFGDSQHWVYIWQILMGAFTAVLAFLVGRYFFCALAGFLAALFVILCPTVMVFEMTLLRTTMTNFFTLLLLYLFVRTLEKQDVKHFILFGIGAGFGLLAQSYFVLFIIPAFMWLLWAQIVGRKPFLKNSLAGMLALLIVLTPLFIRNMRMGVPVTSLASNGAVTYIPNNISNSAPMQTFYVHMPSLARIMHESEGKITRAAFLCLGTFDDMNSFLKIYSEKIKGMFMPHEIPNNMNYYLYREIAPVLQAMPIRYAFIAPLGIAGLLIGLWKHRLRIMPLVLMTVVSIVPLLIAGNMARYRTPLVILLSIFAAAFLMLVVNYFFQKNYKMAFISLAAAALSFLFTMTSNPKNSFFLIPSDLDTFYRHYYLDRLKQYETEGNYQAYLELTTDMVDKIPDYFFNVDMNTRPINNKYEAVCSKMVATYLESHMNILNYLHRSQEATYFNDRINVLRARAEDFDKRLARQG